MAKQYEAFLKLETGTHSANINQLLVTPDGKSLITAGGDKTIRVWDIESKKQRSLLLGQIGAGSDGSIQAITISPDGKYLIALAWMYPDAAQDVGLRETDLRAYELATGNLQAGFSYPGTLQDLDFSLDGKFLALVGNPKESSRRGHVMIHETKKVISGFGYIPAPVASDVLYDNDTPISSYVRFVPEKPGKNGWYRLVVASRERSNKGGKTENGGRLYGYSFSPAAKLKKVYERETEEHIAPDSLTVSRQFTVITAAASSEDINKKFYCYEQDGQFVKAVDSESLPAKPVFSSDGNQLIVGQRNDSALIQVKVYDTARGQFPLKSTYFGHDSAVLATALISDRIAISAGGDQNAIHFWSTDYMEGRKIEEIAGVGRVLYVAGISSDEQIGFGTRDDLRLKDGRIVLQRAFDLHSMRLVSFPFQDASKFRRSQKSFGKQTLKWMEQPGDSNLFLQPDNKAITGIPPVNWYQPSTFGFTEKGSIVTGSTDGKVRVAVRSQDGKYQITKRILVGHEAAVLDHASSDRWLVTVGVDQVIRLWFLADAERETDDPLQPALNLFIGSDDEWVIWSKSGYYNASQRGDRRFGYHINRGSAMESLYYPSDRFIKTFLRPDIIRGIIETGSEERAFEKRKMQDVSVQPVDVSKILPPIVELARNGVTKEKNKVTFNFSVAELNPEQPVTRVWIIQNDQFAWQADKRTRAYKVSLSLMPGRNRFKILAETKNTKSMPLIQDILAPESKPARRGDPGTANLSDAGSSRGAKEPSTASALLERPEMGTLYLLAVGVSEFSDTKSGVKFLKFADDDAVSVYNAFAKTDLSEKVDGKSRSERVRTNLKNKAFESVDAAILTNESAKKADIVMEVDRICTAITKRAKSKKPKRDVLMVFLSGHGVRLVDETIKDIYFWNYDAVFDDLERTALSFIELGKKITSIPADVILVTDACHSGLAGRDLVRGLDANELAKFIYAINERGMYIMNAARGDEQAHEYTEIKHGVFTRSILDALTEDLDMEMSMMRLMDGVQRHVRKWTSKQSPVFRMYGDLLPLTIYKK